MLIKGQMASEPADGFFPGYSASGQDVWVEEAEYHEPGIVLSAVGARCGKAFRADGDWTAVANTQVLLPNADFDRDFLWRVFDDEKFWKKGGSAQPYVQVTDSLDRPWAFPNRDEQEAIAEFLDRETEKIDGLVKKEERLIELLQEYRTALITAAVTGQIDVRQPA
jgi:type I restriction enzyme S subunit